MSSQIPWCLMLYNVFETIENLEIIDKKVPPILWSDTPKLLSIYPSTWMNLDLLILYLTSVHLSVIHVGGQSVCLHKRLVWGFRPTHSDSSRTTCSCCVMCWRQYTGRVFLPPPQVTLQSDHFPIVHLHRVKKKIKKYRSQNQTT